MDESKGEKRASVAKWQAVFGWMSFAVFVAGLLAFIVAIVVLALGTDEVACVFCALCFVVELLATILGTLGDGHRFAEIGAKGAVIMLVLSFCLIWLTLPHVQ
jgi:O-antigen/teichoic acid export membrane protein